MGEIIEQYNIGEVILASSAFSTRDYLLEIFRKYGVIPEKVTIRMSSGLYEILTTSLTVNEFAYVPLVYVNKVRLTGIDSIVEICSGLCSCNCQSDRSFSLPSILLRFW